MYISAGNAYLLALWKGHSAKNPVMQGVHFVWSIGSTLAPFLVQPFLAEVEDEKVNDNWTDNSTYVMLTTQNQINNHTIPPLDNTVDYSFIRYAYMLVGILVIGSSSLFGVLFWLIGPSLLRQKKRHVVTKLVGDYSTSQPRCYRFGFVSLMFVFFFNFLITEAIPGAFLSSFVVKGFGWSVKQGAVITSAYWGAHGVGRMLGIPTAYFLPPRLMLNISMVMICGAYTLMVFAHDFGDVVVYVCVMLGGSGISTVFPSMLLWASKHIKITGFVSGVCLTGCSLGGIIGFSLVGYMFDQLGHMWMVYFVLLTSILSFVVFIILQVYALAANQTVNNERTLSEEINPFQS